MSVQLTDLTQDTILIVEDDPDAMLLMVRALQKGGIKNPVVQFNSAEDARALLDRVADAASDDVTQLPLLIFIDLIMPRMNGFELLEWMLGRPELDYLARAVVSSSPLGEDVKRASDLGASFYLTKPPEAARLTQIVRWAHIRRKGGVEP